MASTGLTPIMEEDQDNLNIQINAEGSSTEVNSSPQQKEPLKIDKSPNPEKEKNIDKNSSLDKKSHRGKGWLLFLTLIIILGIGFNFYANKNDGDFLTSLPESFKNFFLTTTTIKNTLDTELENVPLIPIQEVPKKIAGTSSFDTQLNETPTKLNKEIVEEEISSGTKPKKTSVRSNEEEVVGGKNSLDIQPKGVLDKLSGKNTERTKKINPFDQTINKNKKTINLLRDEIKSLKSKLKKNSSTAQKLRPKNPDTTNSVVEKSISKANTLSKTSVSTKTENLARQNYPQRSKEVQAYLDFIENTGRNFFKLIKDSLGRLQTLAIELEKKYL